MAASGSYLPSSSHFLHTLSTSAPLPHHCFRRPKHNLALLIFCCLVLPVPLLFLPSFWKLVYSLSPRFRTPQTEYGRCLCFPKAPNKLEEQLRYGTASSRLTAMSFATAVCVCRCSLSLSLLFFCLVFCNPYCEFSVIITRRRACCVLHAETMYGAEDIVK